MLRRVEKECDRRGDHEGIHKVQVNDRTIGFQMRETCKSESLELLN